MGGSTKSVSQYTIEIEGRSLEMDDRRLMRLHVETLFTHDPAGRLERVNEPNGGSAPRLFLGRTRSGYELRFRADVPAAVVEELGLLAARQKISADVGHLLQIDPKPYEVVLNQDAQVSRTWTGPSFRFPPHLREPDNAVLVTQSNTKILRPHFENWLDDLLESQPFVAARLEGRAVSVCGSMRITAEAHEAGVETAPEYRGQGYGAAVVAAWAREVIVRGAIPLYSTSWENTASLALARKLNLIQYGSVLHVS